MSCSSEPAARLAASSVPLLATSPARLVVANRTVSRAEALRRHFGGEIEACGFERLPGGPLRPRRECDCRKFVRPHAAAAPGPASRRRRRLRHDVRRRAHSVHALGRAREGVAHRRRCGNACGAGRPRRSGAGAGSGRVRNRSSMRFGSVCAPRAEAEGAPASRCRNPFGEASKVGDGKGLRARHGVAPGARDARLVEKPPQRGLERLAPAGEEVANERPECGAVP